MLSGESLPLIKTPIAAHPAASLCGSEADATKHVLFGGTEVVRAKAVDADGEAVRAMVLRTGFQTTKGDLVRSILHPKDIKFKFYSDSMLFVGILAVSCEL